MSDKAIPSISFIHSNRSSKQIPFYEKLSKLTDEGKIEYELKITGKLEAGEKLAKYASTGRIDRKYLASIIPGN